MLIGVIFVVILFGSRTLWCKGMCQYPHICVKEIIPISLHDDFTDNMINLGHGFPLRQVFKPKDHVNDL